MATGRDDFVIAFRSAFLKKKDKQKFSLFSLTLLSIVVIILSNINFKPIQFVKIGIKAASGSTLTDATKNNIITELAPYNVASVRPEIVDPETTSLVLTVNAKYDKKGTAKTSETLKSEITTAISNYSTNTLSQFDGVFRYSK